MAGLQSIIDFNTIESVTHRHQKAQLLWSRRGVLKCEIEQALWLVPPGSALWIPQGIPHAVTASGEVDCGCLFVQPQFGRERIQVACLAVSPFLGELLLKVSSLPTQRDLDAPEKRLIAVVLDELKAAPRRGMHLPLPVSQKLKKMAGDMLASPGERLNLSDRARRYGMSERTLSRQFQQELGMSFGQWRQRLHVMKALELISSGNSVETVGSDLGYESAASFVTMFRKATGKPPMRYFIDCHSDHGDGEAV